MKTTAVTANKIRLMLSHPDFRSRPVRSLWRVALWEFHRLRDKEVTCKYDSDMTICVSPRDGVGRWIFYFGQYEKRVLRLLDRLLKPGMVFVDVGANVGAHTLFAAKRVRPAGRVIAFEPQRSVLARLNKNIEANGLANVTVEHRAIGETPGMVKVCEQPDSGRTFTFVGDGPEENCYDVPCVTLDEYFRDPDIRVDYLKIDVEGSEMHVLRGGKRFFDETPPRFVQCEIGTSQLQRSGFSEDELAGLLAQHGYVLYAPNWDGRIIRIQGERDLPRVHAGSKEQTKIDILGIHNRVDVKTECSHVISGVNGG